MNKLKLVSFTALPHHSAESIHIVMTANELCEVSDFELVTPAKVWRGYTFSKKLDAYGSGLDTIKQSKFVQLFPNDTTFLRKYCTTDYNGVFYCRQCLVAKYFLDKGFKVGLELHTLPSDSDFLFLKKAFNNNNFRALIVITNSLKTDILEVVGSEFSKQIHVLADAADIKRFYYKPLSEKIKLKVGYIGSNFPGKGWEVIEKLPKESENDFHVYGFSNENNTFSNAFFYGKIPYSNIPKALDSFHIGLLPNQPDVVVANGANIGKYTSPMKLFEYMASGKVIIASDIPVIREVLTNNYNAILVPHNDIKAWVDAIDMLNNDISMYKRLQKQAYKDVCEKYSYKSRAEKIISIINK